MCHYINMNIVIVVAQSDRVILDFFEIKKHWLFPDHVEPDCHCFWIYPGWWVWVHTPPVTAESDWPWQRQLVCRWDCHLKQRQSKYFEIRSIIKYTLQSCQIHIFSHIMYLQIPCPLSVHAFHIFYIIVPHWCPTIAHATFF